MFVFRELSANDAFTRAIIQLNRNGLETAPRGMKIKEFINASITITNPYLNVVSNPWAKVSRKYLVWEWIWYIMGEQDKDASDMIVKHAKFWDTLRDGDGSLNSNYGFYIWNSMRDVINNNNKFFSEDIDWSDEHLKEKPGLIIERPDMSQYKWVMETLAKDPDSRQCVININNIWHKFNDTKDFPCTVYIQFFIRNRKLQMTVNMRSCDIRLGFCNDVFQFTMIQQMLLNDLKIRYPEKFADLRMGTYTLICCSLHLYERHFEMASNIERNQNWHGFDTKENSFELETFSMNDADGLVSYVQEYPLFHIGEIDSINTPSDNAMRLFNVIKDDYIKEIKNDIHN